jgi:serine/threonine-protein kinase
MFIAPEQLRDSAAADTRSDIYGLGCTLYMLLAGHPPFTGDSSDDIIRQHLEDPPRPIARLPQSVMAIINCCLQKDPEDRYPSAAELAADLRGIPGV